MAKEPHHGAKEAGLPGLKRGDVRIDGRIWTGRNWSSPEAWARQLKRDRDKRTGFAFGYVRPRDGMVSTGKSWITPEAWARMVSRNRSESMTLRERAVSLLCAARLRARRKGIPFDLTVEDILPQFEKGKCQVTGIPFDFRTSYESRRKGGFRRNPYAPSLDRIDCDSGYTRDNTLVVIVQFNLGRGQMSIPDYIKFCSRVAEAPARDAQTWSNKDVH